MTLLLRVGRFVAGPIAFVALLAGAAPSVAATAVESGWWTSSPVLLGSAVGEEQLLVQAGVGENEPAAYAAVAFELEPDEAPTALDLEISATTASTPLDVLKACLSTGPISSASGAPAEDGPAYDCESSIEGTINNDRSSYSFDLTRLASRASTLTLALVAEGPGTRVVLVRPTVESLRSTFRTSDGESSGIESPPSGSSGPPVPAVGPSLGLVEPPSARPAAAPPPKSSDDVGDAPPEPEASSHSLDEAAAPATGVSSAAVAPVGGARAPGEGGRSRLFLLGALLAAALVLWTLAGREGASARAERS